MKTWDRFWWTLAGILLLACSCRSSPRSDVSFAEGISALSSLYIQSRSANPSFRDWPATSILEGFMFTNLLASAEAGNPMAQSRVAFCYHFGIGVRRDEVQEEHWRALAARNGDPLAQYNLACHLEERIPKDGNEYPEKYAEVRRWLERSADGGYGYAYQLLSNYYMFWPVPDHSRRKGLRLLQKAVDMGVPLQDYLEAAKRGEFFKNQKWDDPWD